MRNDASKSSEMLLCGLVPRDLSEMLSPLGSLISPQNCTSAKHFPRLDGQSSRLEVERPLAWLVKREKATEVR